MVYRALAPIGMFPSVIRQHEWWEIGVLLGNDIGPPGPRMVIPMQPALAGSGPLLAEVD